MELRDILRDTTYLCSSYLFVLRRIIYLFSTWTSPSEGGASHVHVLKNRRVYVSSWLRRQRRRSLASYWSTNIHGLITRWASCLNILLFIQFIFYMIFDDFWWSIRTYGIHSSFDITFCSSDYYYFYFVYIVILSYSILYCSFNIPCRSSDYFFSRVLLYTQSVCFLV